MASSNRMHKDYKNRVAHKLAPMEYTLDAAGRPLGRVASEAAKALLGKMSVHYMQNKVLPVKVTITNADKVFVSEKKREAIVYTRFTGYPGGLRSTTLGELAAKKGMKEVVRKVVDGMLPRNKLRKERMKRLVITD